LLESLSERFYQLMIKTLWATWKTSSF